jgi:RNA polymerase sigma-70 factor (ECF subfamily)
MDGEVTPEEIAAARRGDRQAMHRAVMTVYGLIRFSVARVIPDRLRSELSEDDLTQEAIAEIVRSFPTLASDDPRAFRKWCGRIAKRRASNQIRQRLARKRGAGQMLDAEIASGLLPVLTRSHRSPRSAVAHAESLENLKELLMTLESDQREILHLRYNEQVPFEEIGRRFGKTGPAIQMLVFRALRRLREMMPD